MGHLRLLLGMIAACATLSAAAPPAPEAQTIWWHTPGAGVVEFEHNRCSLLWYDSTKAFVFTWRRSGTTLDVEDNAGQLPSAPEIRAAVQIGRTWLGSPTQQGELNLTATGDKFLRSITLTQPVLPLFADARHITIYLADFKQDMPVDPAKVPALLHALQRCRDAIR